jgi:hypothetical protein
MKRHYRLYNETLPFEADIDDLKELLEKRKHLLENYQEISSDLDDEMYISRGNGFCTTKWAPDVIDDKIEELTRQIAEINGWIEDLGGENAN